MAELETERRLLLFGRMRSVVKKGLMARYRVNIVHHFEIANSDDENAAIKTGREIIMEGSFDSVLFTASVSRKFREFVMSRLADRSGSEKMVIVALTDEESYEDWIAIPPNAGAEQIAEKMGFPQNGKPAQIIVVMNTKGGVGKSFVATNTAVALAMRGLKVALLEDDWTTRSVKDLMGIDDTEMMSANLVADINEAQGVVTPELLNQYLLPAYNVHTMIGPPNIITTFTVTPEIAKEIIAVLGYELGVDVIVIDAPPDFLRTSSFTLNLLNGTENSPTPPIIMVPIVPETAILRSANDTLAVVQYLNHNIDRIWPVVNCIKGEHQPDMLRGKKVLWTDPKAIIPYCPEAQFVGDRRRPLITEPPASAFSRLVKRILGVADVSQVKAAYLQLADKVIAHIESVHGYE